MPDEQDQDSPEAGRDLVKPEAQGKQKRGSVQTPRAIQQLPPEVREVVSMMGFSGPVTPPFLNKVNEEHISKVLEITDKDSQRTYDDAQSSKKYSLAYVVLSFLLFGFVIVFLADKNAALLKDILIILGVFAGGFGAGYGVKAFKDRD